ncbi:hypothetical protein CRX72_17320 [Pantoea sp. BRM17]|nr:hypothetical protein CRX72_17320 [Pantoea sp. BRM17]
MKQRRKQAFIVQRQRFQLQQQQIKRLLQFSVRGALQRLQPLLQKASQLIEKRPAVEQIAPALYAGAD